MMVKQSLKGTGLAIDRRPYKMGKVPDCLKHYRLSAGILGHISDAFLLLKEDGPLYLETICSFGMNFFCA